MANAIGQFATLINSVPGTLPLALYYIVAIGATDTTLLQIDDGNVSVVVPNALVAGMDGEAIGFTGPYRADLDSLDTATSLFPVLQGVMILQQLHSTASGLSYYIIQVDGVTRAYASDFYVPVVSSGTTTYRDYAGFAGNDLLGTFTGTSLALTYQGLINGVPAFKDGRGTDVAVPASEISEMDGYTFTAAGLPWGFPCADTVSVIDGPGVLVNIVVADGASLGGNLYDATPGREWVVVSLININGSSPNAALLISDGEGNVRVAFTNTIQPVAGSSALAPGSAPCVSGGIPAVPGTGAVRS